MLKIKPVRQTTKYSCGPSSLRMVLAYFGINKSEKYLIKLSGCKSSIGVSGEGILKAAKSLGFNGFIKDNADIKDIKYYVNKKKIPIIVDWFSHTEASIDGHYSVVAYINRKKIFLADPEFGKIRHLDLVTFKRVWFDFPSNYIKSKNELVIRRMIIIYK